ncbi:MAG: FAD:protein FMN transferase [Candidatus Cohnella colombiensis]|uniref:FAD:protein FMN transferase n=1 Tax=Candidatus Cohnella colombiensis TaxID=3121368 RepID=A0AA95F0Z1_9BACL|nr:MAG: FAD:protein FMN transferase [Cohnella sp.]
MDTVVSIQVVCGESNSMEMVEAQINRAFEAFYHVEQACSRFSIDSELMRACRQIETPVPVSPFLFEPLKFALEMAQWTDGVFDPTVGKVMEEHGFNRHYLTGQSVQSTVTDSELVTYRDIVLNQQDRTLYLKTPLVIDLGAVAKGFAIDLAANELNQFEGFVVNAGGDLFAGGVNEQGYPWEIGIQHPESKEHIIHTLDVSNKAVCTSGSYERKSVDVTGMHHIYNPTTRQSPNDWISCTVIAPFAMMADAFSTASFMLGLEKGSRLIEQVGLEGILISSKLQIVKVGGVL